MATEPPPGLWAVGGPPRSATTSMLELTAAYTGLPIRWSLSIELRTRAETGLRENFMEVANPGACGSGLVKVLNPALCPTTALRRILVMRRDPAEVEASARKLGQTIPAQRVAERFDLFVRTYRGRCDVVDVDELADHAALFERLGARGWPVTEPCWEMTTVRGTG